MYWHQSDEPACFLDSPSSFHSSWMGEQCKDAHLEHLSTLLVDGARSDGQSPSWWGFQQKRPLRHHLIPGLKKGKHLFCIHCMTKHGCTIKDLNIVWWCMYSLLIVLIATEMLLSLGWSSFPWKTFPNAPINWSSIHAYTLTHYLNRYLQVHNITIPSPIISPISSWL